MAIITISRGTMSGGRSVAECLAEHLGYPCVGREVIQQAAESLGASEETVHHRLQHPPGPWDLVTRERYTYVVAVQAALVERCVRGQLVYHGLAGQMLLRGLPAVLRVRLIAPLSLRVQAVLARHSHTSSAAAERYIQTVDRQRRRWVKLMYGADIGSPELYDLTVNLQSISLETVCVAVAELAGQPSFAVTDEVRKQLREFATTCRRRLDEVVASRRGRV